MSVRDRVRRTCWAALLALPLALFTVPQSASAASLTQVTGFGSNPGSLSMYTYVPDNLPSGAPVVVALHGCTQSASDYYSHSGWPKYADLYGFALVFPQTSSANNANSCFNWYQSGDYTRGQGEALSIKQMVDYAKTQYGSDPSRVYVTGLSMRRRHDLRDARRLPRCLRGRLHRLRHPGGLRHRSQQRPHLRVQPGQQDPATVGRPGTRRIGRLERTLAAGGRLAGFRRLDRQPRQRHRVPRPVDERPGHRPDPVIDHHAHRRHHPGRLQRCQRRSCRRDLHRLRHGTWPRREPRLRDRPVRHDRHVLPQLHLLQLLHGEVLGPGRHLRRRHRCPARAHRADGNRHHGHQRLTFLERRQRRRFVHHLPRRYEDGLDDLHFVHGHRTGLRHRIQLHRRRRRLIGQGRLPPPRP